MIAYRLQPLERSPGSSWRDARLSGPRDSSWFFLGLRSCLPSETSLHLSGAMLLSPRIASIPFIETRQRAFIFQAQIFPDPAALRDLPARGVDGRFFGDFTNRTRSR